MAEFAVWQQNVAYPARYDRALVAELFGEGVIDVAGGSLRVTERAAGANMSVTPRQGRCVVDGDEQADQEAYLCVFDDAVNLSVASADPDNPRKDRVIVRVQDSAVSGASDGPVREVLTGTAEASPTAPAVPDSAVSLAIVDVAAGASSITDADITDDRTEVAGGLFAAKAGDTMTGSHTWTSGQPEIERTDGSGNTWAARIDFPSPDSPRLNVRKNGVLHARIQWNESAGRWDIGQTVDLVGGAFARADINMDDNRVVNMLPPSGDQDAANKNYVDEGHSTADGLTDITKHVNGTSSSGVTFTLLDVTGAGHLLGGTIQGYTISAATLTIDGVSNTLDERFMEDDAGNKSDVIVLPPVKFDSSCKVTVDTAAGTTLVGGYAWTKP